MLKLSILSLYSMPPPVIPIFIICDMYAQSYGSPIYQNEMDTLPEKDPYLHIKVMWKGTDTRP